MSSGTSCATLLTALGVLLGATLPAAAVAQEGTVSGQVVDQQTADPISGAQVVVQGTALQTLTDGQGEFTIEAVPAGDHVLVVETLGYGATEQAVEISAGETVTVEIGLASRAIDLDQMVVAGQAGERERRAIGNTVSSIRADEITEVAPVRNVREMMSGRSAGLTMLDNSGQAGAGGRIRIRGSGSLQAGNQQPVVYVDGVRMEADNQGGSSLVQPINALDAINPNDIESIEVIKGPAASTMYGADAAAGVIEIRTKQGEEGTQWSASFERGQRSWELPIPNNYTLCTDDRIASESVPGCDDFSSDEPLEDRLLVQNPIEENRPTTLRDGNNHSFNLSSRGGGDFWSYYFSLQDSKEQGVYNNNYDNRRSVRGNFSFTPTERLTFGANVGFTRRHNRMNWANNSSNSILRTGMRGQPGWEYSWEPGWRGLPPELSNEYNNQRWEDRTILGLQMDWQPFDWFDNRLNVGLDRSDRTQQTFYEIDDTGRQPFGSPADQGYISRNLPLTDNWSLDYSGNIRYPISAEFDGNTAFGFQWNRREYENHSVWGDGLVANRLNMVSHAANRDAGQSRSEIVSAGFFLEQQVTWRDRVYLTGAVRVDDNSAFGEDFSFETYPKLQAAWMASEEDFFPDMEWMDEVRLRGAWGRAGTAPGPFEADRTFEPAITTIGDESTPQLAASSYGNPDLRAETGSEIELGFDASFLRDRLGAEVTYYRQSTRNAIINVPVPQSSGWTGSHLMNLGEIRNAGWEFEVTGTPIQRPNVRWQVDANLSTNENELVSFGDAPMNEIAFGAFASVQRHREGYPLGGYWAVDVERDADGVPVLDDSGNAIVLDDREDEIFMGPMLPTREAGLSNSLTLFRDVRLFTHFDYAGGNYQWCAICSVRSRIDQNHWEVNDPNASEEQIAQWSSLQTKTHIKPADFVKLRELSVSYSLPSEWIAPVRADDVTLTLAGRNLWMWTRYRPYRGEQADPEVQFYAGQTFTTLDYASTPMTRHLSFEIRTQF